MSEIEAGPDLDAAIGALLGLDVLGVAPCSREPECGEWEPTGQWAGSGREGAPRPVYLRHCCCEFAEPEDVRILGHLSFCLAVVPAYSAEIAAAWQVLERVRELGHTEWLLERYSDGYAVIISRPRSGRTCEHPAESCCTCWEWVQRTAETAPEAICRAALAVVGGEP